MKNKRPFYKSPLLYIYIIGILMIMPVFPVENKVEESTLSIINVPLDICPTGRIIENQPKNYIEFVNSVCKPEGEIMSTGTQEEKDRLTELVTKVNDLSEISDLNPSVGLSKNLINNMLCVSTTEGQMVTTTIGLNLSNVSGREYSIFYAIETTPTRIFHCTDFLVENIIRRGAQDTDKLSFNLRTVEVIENDTSEINKGDFVTCINDKLGVIIAKRNIDSYKNYYSSCEQEPEKEEQNETQIFDCWIPLSNSNSSCSNVRSVFNCDYNNQTECESVQKEIKKEIVKTRQSLLEILLNLIFGLFK